MTNPRFVPRSYAKVPREYGRAAVIDWIRVVHEYQRDQLGAAKLQHDVAVRIDRLARSEYGTLKKFATAADVNYVRLAAILRGTQVMRLEDVAMCQRMFGDSTVRL